MCWRSTLAVGLLIAAVGSTGTADAGVVQERGIRIAVDGSLAPKVLPRHGRRPVSVSLSGRITQVAPGPLPQLRRVTLELNSQGIVDPSASALCPLREIRTATNSEALRACRAALVGEGRFSADVRLPSQSPFPSNGRLLAFNGRLHGSPAILAHVYGTEPYPTSYVLPFVIGRGRGAFGTVLEAKLPAVTGEWGYVTGITMHIGGPGNSPTSRGAFISAGCPAPEGIDSAVFPLARETFSFAGGAAVSSVITRSCHAG